MGLHGVLIPALEIARMQYQKYQHKIRHDLHLHTVQSCVLLNTHPCFSGRVSRCKISRLSLVKNSSSEKPRAGKFVVARQFPENLAAASLAAASSLEVIAGLPKS